jgi:pimeloyl-ACP methyl ester carboxylesterase
MIERFFAMAGRKNTLFLHGGPGLHSAVERVWFGDALNVEWWDQPSVAADLSPFSALVTHATRRIDALAASGDGQVNVIAHSFGGLIAVELTRKYPELIGSITLLGCPPDPIRQFVLLARRLLEIGADYPGLSDALDAVENNCDTGCFFALVQACYPGGSIPDIFFGPGSADVRARYLSIVAHTPAMDAASFFVVMELLRSSRSSLAEVAYQGEVRIFLGQHDPMLDLDSDHKTWLGVFPQAKISTVNAGHGVHFEVPAEIWLGAGQVG